MTKKQLAAALKRARKIYGGTDELTKDCRSLECVAAAYGYLESAVEEYIGQLDDADERRKLARDGVNYQ